MVRYVCKQIANVTVNLTSNINTTTMWSIAWCACELFFMNMVLCLGPELRGQYMCVYARASIHLHGTHARLKEVALETAGTGVTCNAVCPGWVLTPCKRT